MTDELAPGKAPRDDGLDDLAGDLATCSRLLAFQGIIDYSGHVSARIPGREAMLIQPRDSSRAALTGADMLVVALDGTVLTGDGVPPVEWPIHAGAYLARPDVGMVCHGHPTASTSFTMTDRPLLPMRHFAHRFPDGLAVHPDPTHIVTMEQGDALAATLGEAGACLIRAHGTLVVAATMQELFMDCLDLEENARTLLNATAAGGTLLPLTAQEIAHVAASYRRSGHRPNKVWQHYLHLGRAAGVL